MDEFGGLGGEVEGFGAGFFEAVEGGVGGFSSLAVGADGFAELFGGGGFVRDRLSMSNSARGISNGAAISAPEMKIRGRARMDIVKVFGFR